MYRWPRLLVVEIKRFQYTSLYRSKLDMHIEIPKTVDLSNFQDDRAPSGQSSSYRLVGVINHSGSMSGGHYTAFVLVFPYSCVIVLVWFFYVCLFLIVSVWPYSASVLIPDTALLLRSPFFSFFPCRNCCLPNGKWYHFNDSHVSSNSNISGSAAYVLVFEQIL